MFAYNTYVYIPLVTINIPPKNRTICKGSNVNISCGYQWSIALPVTWIINGTSFTQQEVVDSPLYQLNHATAPMTHSLTVFLINSTTTFQCIVHSTPDSTSTLGTVTVTTGMYVHTYVTVYVCAWLVLYSLDYPLSLLTCLNRF